MWVRQKQLLPICRRSPSLPPASRNLSSTASSSSHSRLPGCFTVELQLGRFSHMNTASASRGSPMVLQTRLPQVTRANFASHKEILTCSDLALHDTSQPATSASSSAFVVRLMDTMLTRPSNASYRSQSLKPCGQRAISRLARPSSKETTTAHRAVAHPFIPGKHRHIMT